MYFDDLAVWVRTQKGSIVRGIMCALLIIFGIIGIIGQWRTHDDLEEIVERNKNTLATQSFEVQQLKQRIDSFDDVTLSDSQSASEIGYEIASLQSKYGGFLDLNANPAIIAENQQEIESELRQYIIDGLRRYEWYAQRRVTYTWECLSNMSFLMNGATTLPVLFKCTLPVRNRIDPVPLAVALGHIDMTTGKLVSLQIWNTKGGEELIADTGEVLNANPSFGKIFTYDAYNNDREIWMRVYKGEDVFFVPDADEDELVTGENTTNEQTDQTDQTDSPSDSMFQDIDADTADTDGE